MSWAAGGFPVNASMLWNLHMTYPVVFVREIDVPSQGVLGNAVMLKTVGGAGSSPGIQWVGARDAKHPSDQHTWG